MIFDDFTTWQDGATGGRGTFLPLGPENPNVSVLRELYLRAQKELGVVRGLYPCVRE